MLVCPGIFMGGTQIEYSIGGSMMGDLKIITMRDVQAENVDWLWKPYIPEGKITIVQGDPGSGKTTSMLAVAAAVTTGEYLPCDESNEETHCACTARNIHEPASVIFQTAEDGIADTIKPRLEALGADCSRVHVIDENERVLSLADERIEQAIIRTGAKLLVIDPLQAYLGGSDMHSAAGIRPLMKHLTAVAERTGCAIVLIGHLNKKGGRSQYRGLGSIDIYAAARSVLTVGKIDVDENMRAVVQGKSNLAAPGAPIAFGLEPGGGLIWLGKYDISLEELLSGKANANDSVSQLAKARLLLETMLAVQAIPAVEVMGKAEERGISPKTLNRAKAALGIISTRKGGQWYWQMPVTGEYVIREHSDKVIVAGQDGQQCQDSHSPSVTTLNALTILPVRRAG